MPTNLTLTTTSSQPTQQITLPTAWPEVTLAQYLVILAAGPLAVVPTLTGLSTEALASLSPTDQTLLASRLSFVLDPEPLLALLPTPGLLEIGRSAFGLLQQYETYAVAHPTALPLARGAYLYALYRAPTGSRMPESELAAAHAAVLAQPVTAVYADCAHFLASYERVATGTIWPGPAQPGLLQLVVPAAPTLGLFEQLRHRVTAGWGAHA
jgi:hypothetical protein